MEQRILVIDDEPDVTTYLAALLEDAGYVARCAADGEEGLALLRRESFDLVLLDHRMPGQTGVRLYVQLQRDERLRGIPVIMVTGVGSVSFLDERCQPLPAPAAVVEKPVDARALLEVVRAALAGAGQGRDRSG